MFYTSSILVNFARSYSPHPQFSPTLLGHCSLIFYTPSILLNFARSCSTHPQFRPTLLGHILHILNLAQLCSVIARSYLCGQQKVHGSIVWYRTESLCENVHGTDQQQHFDCAPCCIAMLVLCVRVFTCGTKKNQCPRRVVSMVVLDGGLCVPKTNFNGVFSMVLLDALGVGIFTRRIRIVHCVVVVLDGNLCLANEECIFQ